MGGRRHFCRFTVGPTDADQLRQDVRQRLRHYRAVDAHRASARAIFYVGCEKACFMESECVYDCIHPWWGGNGICTASDAGDPVCVCDDDYASRDAKGSASCVPRRVLVAAYLTLATLSVAAAALIVWNINQYRHLPVRVQSAKKTSIRMRALVSTRCGFFLSCVRACVQFSLCRGW